MVAAPTPASVGIDNSEAGRDLSVTTVHLYLGGTGETRHIALDRNGSISIVESDGVAKRSPVVGPPAGANPYKGLEAFQENDAGRFFGRDAITALLWERFRALQTSGPSDDPPLRLLPILGPTGSGKSSLARAGLIPKLIRHPLPGFGSSRVAIFTPGFRPLEALASVLARIETGNVDSIKRAKKIEEALAKTYRSGRQEGLRRITESLPNAESTPLIFLIDQFEEVFSLCYDVAMQSTFFDNLLNAASDPGGAVSIIINLRSDFLGATVHHQALNQALSKLAIIVPVMSKRERRDAIEQPALRAGRPIDIATVDLLMEQTAGREGALPLLQFVLSRIWEGLNRGVAPGETVKNLGGVGGALAGEAQSIYDALDSTQKHIARRAFLSLIQLGEGTRDTLRRSYLSDMTAHTEAEPDVRRVLEQFAGPGRRLISLSSDPTGQTTVAITHEALVDNWSALQRWIEASRDDIRLHRRFAESVRNWDMQKRPDGLLWRSPDLDLLKQFCVRVEHDLTEIQAAFLEAAIALEARERKERRRREREEREHAENQNVLDAVGQLSVGIVILNEEEIVLQVNRGFRRMTNAAGGGIGRSCGELFASNDHPAIMAMLEHCRREKSSAPPVEVHPICAQPVVAQLSAIRIDDRPEARRILLCLVDTTEQKRLELQFAQSQKMQAMGQLAGGTAHDFNNLLTAMMGFCDLLLMRHQAGDQSFADIMQIKQNVNRAARLVRQLLAFSRRQTLQLKVLALTDVLAELSNLLRRLIGENIELRMIHSRDLGLVKVDQGQIEQVIINLAVNARDAMPDGGTLTIRTSNIDAADCARLGHDILAPADYVCIEVTDTGTGIAKEHLGKIFEPFFSTKDVGAGTGLGLSTVYGIVKQTGGFVFVKSTLGVGAAFTVFLPRHHRSADEIEAGQAPVRRGPVKDLTGKGTILLVEDEDSVRTFGARALRSKGYTVLEADSAEAALEVIGSYDGDIDLLITDVVMPQMNGAVLVERVRESQPDLKVIFISGYAEDAFRKSLSRPEEIEFLPKPFSLAQLAGKVKDVIEAPSG